MRIEVYYDDTVKKSEIIKDIIGERGFAEVVIRKKTIEKYYQESLNSIFPDFSWNKISSIYEYKKVQENIDERFISEKKK